MRAVHTAMSHRDQAKPVVGVLLSVVLLATVGCRPQQDPEEAAREERIRQTLRDAAIAQAALRQIETKYYLPAATAPKEVRAQLLADAEENYLKLVQRFPEQTNVAAQAWRNLGNVLGEQGRLREAVGAFGRVVADYPTADGLVLQSLKAAGDLMWDSGRTNEASPLYAELVERFGPRTNEAEVIARIVHDARQRIVPEQGDRTK
jgi:tetratricopeptide (TPR) repeat protein